MAHLRYLLLSTFQQNRDYFSCFLGESQKKSILANEPNASNSFLQTHIITVGSVPSDILAVSQ